jgi:hypothetical protein
MRHRAHDHSDDATYVRLVRAAVEATVRTSAGQALPEVYLVLASELQRRGIEPEPDAVYDGAWLISHGRRPAVLAEYFA